MVDVFSKANSSYHLFHYMNADHYDDLVDLLYSASDGIKIFSTLCVFGPFKSLNLAFLLNFLSRHSMQFIYLNCLEDYSEQNIIISIFKYAYYRDNYIPSNLLNFLNLFRTDLKSSTLFLICDNADYLVKYDSQFLSSFTCMFEQPSWINFCLIFLTEIPLGCILNTHPNKDMVQLYIPPFSREEISQLIIADKARHSHILHVSFLQNMWHHFSNIFQNLAEFSLACCETFPYYIEPFEKSKISAQDPRLLWKMLESLLIEKYTFETDNKFFIPGFVNTSYFHRISHLSRILLVSIYLSSHSIQNQCSKRCFTRAPSLYCKPITYFPDIVQYIPFSFDKLIAVSYRVRGIHTSCSVNVFTLIATLISIRLFIQTNHSASCRSTITYFSILNEHTYIMLCNSINLPIIENFQ